MKIWLGLVQTRKVWYVSTVDAEILVHLYDGIAK